MADARVRARKLRYAGSLARSAKVLCLQERHGRDVNTESLSRTERPECTRLWSNGPVGGGGLLIIVRQECMQHSEVLQDRIVPGREHIRSFADALLRFGAPLLQVGSRLLFSSDVGG